MHLATVNSRHFLGGMLCFAVGVLAGCGRETSMSAEIRIGSSPGASDPPYSGTVTFPNGLRLSLIQDRNLTATYPAPGSNSFGTTRMKHYNAVAYFIDLARTDASELVTPNFRLAEYVSPTMRRGGTRAYVDPQIVDHVQLIRSGLGRPLVITSNFRTPEHNREVGGATYSRHIYGDAVDVDVDQSRVDADVRAQEIFNESRDVGVDFILPLTETSVSVSGQQRVSWVHIDDRGF